MKTHENELTFSNALLGLSARLWVIATLLSLPMIYASSPEFNASIDVYFLEQLLDISTWKDVRVFRLNPQSTLRTDENGR
ncbi:MAG: hypothetical protein KAI06_06405 [Anaerolineales bacterium]|nr:hypothetical protein [Anaerolineales bacterium]